MDTISLGRWVKGTGGEPAAIPKILEAVESWIDYDECLPGGTRHLAAIAVARMAERVGALDRLPEVLEAPCTLLGLKTPSGDGRFATQHVTGHDAPRHAVGREVPCSSLLDLTQYYLSSLDLGDHLRTAFPEFNFILLRIAGDEIGALVTARLGPPTWRQEISVGVHFGDYPARLANPDEGAGLCVMQFAELAVILHRVEVLEQRGSLH